MDEIVYLLLLIVVILGFYASLNIYFSERQKRYRYQEKKINQYARKSRKGINFQRKILIIFAVILIGSVIYRKFFTVQIDYISEHMQQQQLVNTILFYGMIAFCYFGFVSIYADYAIESIIRRILVKKYECANNCNKFEMKLNNGITSILSPIDSNKFVQILRYNEGPSDCELSMQFFINIPYEIQRTELELLMRKYPIYEYLDVNIEMIEYNTNLTITYKEYNSSQPIPTIERFFIVYDTLIEIAYEICLEKEYDKELL